MENQEFGNLEKIELRNRFKNEEYDFTPWLAKRENIQKLADELGIEINDPKLEGSVGKYSSDINAEDENKDPIVIENQLEISDNEHLGKLITYSAGHEAKTLIWIAKDIREEHIKAINFLNENSDKNMNIFAIKIELWKIGNSLIAPKFNIICKPNNWARIVRNSNNNSERSETQLKQIDFWIKYDEQLKNNKSEMSVRSPERSDRYAYIKNNKKLDLWNFLNEKNIGCNIVIKSNEKNKEIIDILNSKEKQKEIEHEFGEKLDFRPNPQSIVIRLSKTTDYNDEKEFNINSKWLETTSEKFIKTFSKYLT